VANQQVLAGRNEFDFKYFLFNKSRRRQKLQVSAVAKSQAGGLKTAFLWMIISSVCMLTSQAGSRHRQEVSANADSESRLRLQAIAERLRVLDEIVCTWR
jgi:hypothetical protein